MKASKPRKFTFGPSNRMEGTYVVREGMVVITTPFGPDESGASDHERVNDFVARDLGNALYREHEASRKAH